MTTSGPGSDSLCLLTKPKVPLVLLLLRPNKQTWQNKSWNESSMKLTVAIFDEWVFFCQLVLTPRSWLQSRCWWCWSPTS